LAQVAEETFESLTFLLPIDITENEFHPPDNDRTCTAWVGYAGHFSGALVVTVSEDMLAPMAVNILGLDEDSPPDETVQIDALKELVNVVCGNVLPQIAGTHVVFNVHAPQLADENLSHDNWEGLTPAVTVDVFFEEGQATLSLFFQPDAVLMQEFGERS